MALELLIILWFYHLFLVFPLSWAMCAAISGFWDTDFPLSTEVQAVSTPPFYLSPHPPHTYLHPSSLLLAKWSNLPLCLRGSDVAESRAAFPSTLLHSAILQVWRCSKVDFEDKDWRGKLGKEESPRCWPLGPGSQHRWQKWAGEGVRISVHCGVFWPALHCWLASPLM